MPSVAAAALACNCWRAPLRRPLPPLARQGLAGALADVCMVAVIALCCCPAGPWPADTLICTIGRLLAPAALPAEAAPAAAWHPAGAALIAKSGLQGDEKGGQGLAVRQGTPAASRFKGLPSALPCAPSIVLAPGLGGRPAAWQCCSVLLCLQVPELPQQRHFNSPRVRSQVSQLEGSRHTAAGPSKRAFSCKPGLESVDMEIQQAPRYLSPPLPPPPAPLRPCSPRELLALPLLTTRCLGTAGCWTFQMDAGGQGNKPRNRTPAARPMLVCKAPAAAAGGLAPLLPPPPKVCCHLQPALKT
jgi:hypothetical protein